MRRREFIKLVGGAATWPIMARAQQSTMPVIGFFHTGEAAHFGHLVAAFRQGLADAGYVEGRNVAFEYRWANSQYDRLPALAADLVSRKPAVIFVAGGPPGVLAVKNATATIPIVFVSGDPIRFGLVKSLSRPEANLTGIGIFTPSIGSKRLELLRHFVPSATVVGFLLNPTYLTAEDELKDMQEAARAAGLQLAVVRASTPSEIDAAFETLAERRAQALVIGASTAFTDWRQQIIALTLRHKMPSIHFQREYAADGGLMSYGNNLADSYRQASAYIDRLLKGAKPADLPVQQATKFELVLNLKTAKALGLEIHPQLLATADEVIE